MSGPDAGARRGHQLAAAVLVLAVLAAYANTAAVPFTLDDLRTIVDNPRIRRLADVPRFFVVPDGPVGTRPLLLATLALNWRLGGLEPYGYHLFNTLLHAANAVLLYLFLFRTLTLPAAGRAAAQAGPAAFAAALLFALHPLQTEAVTYVVSRSMPLAALFFLAGLLAHAAAVRSGGAWSAVTALCAFCGMASREDFIVFPAALLLYDALLLSSPREALRRWRLHLALAVAVAYRLWLTLAATDAPGAAGFGMTEISPWHYLLTQSLVVWKYVALLLLPLRQNLDYQFPAARTALDPRVLAALAGHAALLLLALGLRRRAPVGSFAILWWYLLLAPSSSVVPIRDLIFEHRVYLASAGPFLLAGLALFGARRIAPAGADAPRARSPGVEAA